MTDNALTIGNLRVAEPLAQVVTEEILPGIGITAESFWQSLESINADLGPINRNLLRRRDELQTALDEWFEETGDAALAAEAQASFLRQIGYLVDEPEDVQISVDRVDREIAELAGPQLVVPVDNARYALNAANARWGSLYDALYGTDVIADTPGAERATDYNPTRGALVIARAAEFLDQSTPLEGVSHSEVLSYQLYDEAGRKRLGASTAEREHVVLADPAQLVGFRLQDGELSVILLRCHGLHIEIQIDREDTIGRDHPAGVKDVVLEAALTTIEDCEDSVAAVDAQDKARVYANWAGLMKGTLEATFEKSGRTVNRRLAADREYVDPAGMPLILPGRSLLLVRNVGIHMYTDAVSTSDGEPIPEGFLDALVTCAAAKHDVLGAGHHRNSREGNVYIVKPKLHGPEEVAFTVQLFERVERALGLAPNTVKLGIMDEERRTTVNLKACIDAARNRVIFINTGFLDRTGDEIHTLMEAGPFIPKQEIKQAAWMLGYEDWNVDLGLACGLSGSAQIGKGMWAMPDEMAQMVEQKVAHPESGANTAWVPSPTAATLHAMHYHSVDVAARQEALRSQGRRATLADVLTPSLLGERALADEEIRDELANNAQGILGYVVRWVEQGVGCSKVPDIHDVGLMEDRATLRIASQLLANWLHHDLIDETAIKDTFRRMAEVVDRQNHGDPAYRPMADRYDESEAFQAALELVFQGRAQPNGYTEFILHARRRQFKERIDG